MKEFVAMIFSENNSELHIDLFSIWHFMYLIFIIEGSIILAIILSKRSQKAKNKAMQVFAYLTIGFYIADFFIMPLSDSYSGIGIDKLPFHICTLTGVFVPFAQFNERFKPIKHIIVSLAVTSSLMWMCYPGSALGGQPPFSYIIFQTFMFHGFLFCWGFLNLALGEVKLNFKKIWQEACAIVIIMAWATFGNAIYPNDQNWLFLSRSIFPFLKDSYMPFAVFFSIFGTCALVYCSYYLVSAIAKKHSAVYSKEHIGNAKQ